MQKLSNGELSIYVEKLMHSFHKKCISCLNKLTLNKIMKRTNPYLLAVRKSQNIETFIRKHVDFTLALSEKTIFGNCLERLVIFVNGKVYGGIKSSAKGVDLEFTKDNIRYIVAIKSSPKWENSSTNDKMRKDFKTIKKTLQTSGSELEVIAVNGCCYGYDNKPDKKGYWKYCGQAFWEFISGDPEFYIKIITPLQHRSEEMNAEYIAAYERVIRNLVNDFDRFCKDYTDEINWNKLIKYNTGNPNKPDLPEPEVFDLSGKFTQMEFA